MSNFFSSLKTEKLLSYVSKQQENKHSRRLSEIAFTILVITLFIFFALKPTLGTISDLMGKIKSKKMLVTEMDKKIKNLLQAQDNFAKIQNEYPIIQSCVPSRPSYYNAAVQIKKAGEKNNIDFSKFSFNLTSLADQKKTKEDDYSFIININNQADFVNLLETINKISQSRRPLTINSFNFAIPKLQTKDASVSADAVNIGLNVKYYYLEDTK